MKLHPLVLLTSLTCSFLMNAVNVAINNDNNVVTRIQFFTAKKAITQDLPVLPGSSITVDIPLQEPIWINVKTTSTFGGNLKSTSTMITQHKITLSQKSKNNLLVLKEHSLEHLYQQNGIEKIERLPNILK